MTNAGGPITYPATDSAEVTALRVDIGPGGETGRHMHLYPAFVYVLEGAIEVEIEGGGGHSYKAGDSFVEAINGRTSSAPIKTRGVALPDPRMRPGANCAGTGRRACG